MNEWITYMLNDMLPVTPDVYFRLFERHNEAVWPAQIVAAVLGLLAIYFARRGRGFHVALLLGLCWIFVGVTFHIERYANLNWAATYFGIAFLVQAALLLVSGLRGKLDADPKRMDAPAAVGLALAVLGLVGYPLLAPLAGRSWTGGEVFAVAPDPTAIVTLGLVLMAARTRWLLLVIPLLWCGISGFEALAMEEAAFGLVSPALALVALAVAIWKSLGSPQPTAAYG